MSQPEDRVLETSTTTGTGNITVAGAVTGYRTWGSAYSVGAIGIPYYIEGVDANGNASGEYETGWGSYSASNTLRRDKVSRSSNSNALVNFSAGTKRVGVTIIGDDVDSYGRSCALDGGLIGMH